MGNWELEIENWGLRIDVILIGSVKILDGGLTFGGDTFAFEDLEDGQEEDLEIEGEGQMVNIIDIQLEFFGPRDGVTAIDLSPAAEAGTDFMTPHLFFAIEGEIADQQGTGTNESHIALKDIKELGKLVDGKGPHNLTHFCQPEFIRQRNTFRITLISHSLKLDNLENFPFQPRSFLREKSAGPLVGKVEEDCDNDYQPPDEQQGQQGAAKTQTTFNKMLVHRIIELVSYTYTWRKGSYLIWGGRSK